VDGVRGGAADDEAEQAEAQRPGEHRGDQPGGEAAPSHSGDTGGEVGVHAHPRQQPADHDPGPAAHLEAAQHAVQALALAQPGGQAPERRTADGAGPAVSDDPAAAHRQGGGGDEQGQAEMAGGGDDAARDEQQVAGEEREGDAALLGEQHGADQHHGGRPVHVQQAAHPDPRPGIGSSLRAGRGRWGNTSVTTRHVAGGRPPSVA
jgi:hypothetical protein